MRFVFLRTRYDGNGNVIESIDGKDHPIRKFGLKF